jgi:polyhydroxyalkanoate synthase
VAKRVTANTAPPTAAQPAVPPAAPAERKASKPKIAATGLEPTSPAPKPRFAAAKSTLAPDRKAAGQEAESTEAAATAAKPELAKRFDAAKPPAASPRGELATPLAKPQPAPEPAKPKAPEPSQTPLPNFEQLSRNVARYIEEGGKVLAAYLKPIETGETKLEPSEEMGQMFTTLGRVAEYYASDAQRAFKAQAALSAQFLDLWSTTLRRLQGEETSAVAAPEPGDKRFSDPEWRDNPYFDFIKQAYVLTTRWADDLVKRADELDPHTREKAAFYLKQVTSALSPSNFIATNPELLKTTLAESGENLVRGLHMMAEDIEAGHGSLRIRQADAAKFKLGVNLAVTPGKVVFRNELIELIQYAPSTPEVYRRPLLIVPPWINKFYILDLNPEKSFIRWAVEQGLTVFVVSWVNPDERHADKGFEAYMREGVFAALDVIEQATGERRVTAIGYCVGGTLLAVTLAFMAEIGDDRIESATFFTTQVDFTDAGDLKIFVDAEQLKSIEAKMSDTGYLDGAHMATAFNMLRPNDLIWSYWVNNYLKGKEPMAFDLLVWNSDSTRMPAANHRFYLRHCYLQNDLTNDRMTIEGREISLKRIKIPVYNLAAKEDHIAPARSVFNGAKHFGGPMRYVLAGSGHIAGVVNPPAKPKYQYWTGGRPEGSFSDWLAAAKETPGSWWLDWIQWIVAQAPEKVPAREPGGGKIAPLCDAPGEYVRVRV